MPSVTTSAPIPVAADSQSRLRRLAKKVVYNTYTTSERCSTRHNFFRNLGVNEWKALYGPGFAYSSDYVHTHPERFGGFTKISAIMANRAEELGEVVFRYTGCWCRSSGSLVLHALRDMGGRGRFASRLSRHMGANRGPLAQGAGTGLSRRACQHIFDALFTAKPPLVNRKGCLLKPVDDLMIKRLLLELDTLGVALGGAHALPPDLVCLCDGLKGADSEVRSALHSQLLAALGHADLTRSLAQMPRSGKAVMTVGCALSALSFAVLYLGVSTAVSSAQGAWLAKAGMLSACLFTTAFILRTVATVSARMTRAHGRGGSSHLKPIQPYMSLFDHMAFRLIRHRNSVYEKGAQALNLKNFNLGKGADEDFDAAWKYERRAAMALYRNDDGTVPVLVKALAGVSNGLHRFTDVVFSMDRIVSQGVITRPCKLGLFRYHSNIELKQGLSANGKCASDYSLQKAENTVGGRFRRGVASFIGFGGLESLGMAVGCGTCSTIWSALNTALPGSGLFAIAGPPAGDLVVGIGFASVCAMGWAASSLTEGAARIGMVLSSKGQTGSGGEDPPDGQRAPLLLAAQGAQRYPAAA